MSEKDEYDVNADLADDQKFEKRRDAEEMKEEQKSFNNEEPPDCLKCTRTGVCFPMCIEMLGIDPFRIAEPTGRIIKALRIAMDYGTDDGAHHKAHAIDQMVRALVGDQYDKFVKIAGPWDEG